MILFIVLLLFVLILISVGTFNSMYGFILYSLFTIGYVTYTNNNMNQYDTRINIKKTLKTSPEGRRKYYYMTNSN